MEVILAKKFFVWNHEWCVIYCHNEESKHIFNKNFIKLVSSFLSCGGMWVINNDNGLHIPIVMLPDNQVAIDFTQEFEYKDILYMCYTMNN